MRLSDLNGQNPTSSISDATASAKNLPPEGAARTYDTFECPLLPNPEGTAWGRSCKVKRLNLQEQITYLGRVRDGVLADRKRREEGDLDAPNDDESQKFWESVWLLSMSCVEPSFSNIEAIEWTTLDEKDGINCASVCQFLLYKIKSLNDEQPGLEDVAGGLDIMRQMPSMLQKLETAFLAGDGSLSRLVRGDSEEAAHIELWGAIMAEVAWEAVRKRAKIEADMTAEAIIQKLSEFGLQTGFLQKA